MFDIFTLPAPGRRLLVSLIILTLGSLRPAAAQTPQFTTEAEWTQGSASPFGGKVGPTEEADKTAPYALSTDMGWACLGYFAYSALGGGFASRPAAQSGPTAGITTTVNVGDALIPGAPGPRAGLVTFTAAPTGGTRTSRWFSGPGSESAPVLLSTDSETRQSAAPAASKSTPAPEPSPAAPFAVTALFVIILLLRRQMSARRRAPF